jgi:hypothetical protein
VAGSAESGLQERRGRDRLCAEGAGHPRELVFADRVLVTLAVLRLAVPPAALAVMLGVDRSTVTRAVTEVRSLLVGRRLCHPVGPRLHTLADVFAYAAARGVKLRIDGSEIQVRRPRAGRPGRRAVVSGKMKQNTIKFTKVSDERGRTLWDGAFCPGRMHDQTALQADGIDDLLEQFPGVQAEMDSGYRGLHRDHPGQVSVPPLKPRKNAPRRRPRPGSRPATPSHQRGSAWSTPSPSLSTGGPSSAGPGGARTCPRPSRRSARWYPTAPPPGSKPLPGNHASARGKDTQKLIAHQVVSAGAELAGMRRSVRADSPSTDSA